MNKNLKPCPFCNGEAGIYKFLSKGIYAECKICSARTKIETQTLFNNKRKAVINEWNKGHCYKAERCEQCGNESIIYP